MQGWAELAHPCLGGYWRKVNQCQAEIIRIICLLRIATIKMGSAKKHCLLSLFLINSHAMRTS